MVAPRFTLQMEHQKARSTQAFRDGLTPAAGQTFPNMQILKLETNLSFLQGVAVV